MRGGRDCGCGGEGGGHERVGGVVGVGQEVGHEGSVDGFEGFDVGEEEPVG